jgi:hypothetical protein
MEQYHCQSKYYDLLPEKMMVKVDPFSVAEL